MALHRRAALAGETEAESQADSTLGVRANMGEKCRILPRRESKGHQKEGERGKRSTKSGDAPSPVLKVDTSEEGSFSAELTK